VYTFSMKRELLKKILKKHYGSNDTIKSILTGRRKPSYCVMLKINQDDNIPFTAWKNIKSFLSEESITTKENNK